MKAETVMAQTSFLGNSTRLTAGAAAREITPPLEVGLLMSSVEGRWQQFDGVRKELFARAVFLEGESAAGTFQRVAIVSLDLLALSGKALGGFPEFKTRIAAASGNVVKADEIVLSCTHSHSAPESGALTELYRTPEYQPWLEWLTQQIGEAIAAATREAEPCRASYSVSSAPGLGIHRRIKTTEGILMSHPEPPVEIVVSREGPVDDSVNVIAFRNGEGALKALIVNATCHPVYEMCIPMISPDYPGELTSLLDDQYAGAVTLFLNGAAGNINPQGVSAGPEASRLHAETLADAVQSALKQEVVETAPYLQLGRASCELATRLPQGANVGVTLTAQIAAVQIGSAAIVFLPGEPFVETGLAIRKASTFECTAIVGFSEETVGYIPTDAAFEEGGYEIGFGTWSMVTPGSEQRMRHEAMTLLDALVVGVDGATESSAPEAMIAYQTPVAAVEGVKR